MNIDHIITEEINRYLREDVEESYFEYYDTLKNKIFNDFLYRNNNDFTKHIYWTVIPFARIKKIWEDYVKSGVVRDESGLNMIKKVMTINTIKVNIITELSGHKANYNPYDDFNEYFGVYIDGHLNCLIPEKKIDTSQLEIPFDNPTAGFKKKPKQPEPEPCTITPNPYIETFFNDNYDNTMSRDDIKKLIMGQLIERFYNYYTDNDEMGNFMSDYGLKPLLKNLYELMRSNKAENDLVIIDKMLNIIHYRSDIAMWFIEGGSSSLDKLSGYYDDNNDSKISGKSTW